MTKKQIDARKYNAQNKEVNRIMRIIFKKLEPQAKWGGK